jgi:hypothetical protein
LLISAFSTEIYFEGNIARENQKDVLFLHNKLSAYRSLATLKKLAYLGFNVFITHPILRI